MEHSGRHTRTSGSAAAATPTWNSSLRALYLLSSQYILQTILQSIHGSMLSMAVLFRLFMGLDRRVGLRAGSELPDTR